jgi:Zn-dependent protease
MLRPGNFQLARIFGIRIGVNASWFLFLFISVFWLSDQFRALLNSETEAYVFAVISALAFFASLIMHELGHALVARREGIEIAGIDLWFFGGIARMTRLPDTPGAELKIAAAGPLATLAVVLVCGGAGILLDGSHFFHVLDYSAARADGGLLVLGWLANINALILLFNLVPAYPLDGGRIAQAIAWRATGDRNRGTRFSARIGQGFAYLLGGFGALLLLSGTSAFGLWMLAIAFIISQAAKGAVLQSAFSERLEGVTVADIMDRDPVTVPDSATLLAVEEQYFLRYRWPWFAVVDDQGRFLGILRRERVEAEIAGGRPALPAREALEEEATQWRIGPDASLEALLASDGLRRLGGVAAVDADGVLRGVVTLSQVRRALTPATGL